jgi:hypothetical protein
MKNIKNPNIRKRIFLVISIAMVLFVSHLIFINYFEKMGSPIRKDISLDLTAGKYSQYGIDSLSLYDERNYLFILSGWAYSISNANEPTDSYKTEIILFNETQNFVFESIPQRRADIVTTYDELSIGNVGFNVIINRNVIPLEKFCIGVLLSNMDNGTQYFIRTNQVVQKKIFKLSLAEEDDIFCEALYEENID